MHDNTLPETYVLQIETVLATKTYHELNRENYFH